MEVIQNINNLVTDLLNNNKFTVVASLILAMYAGLAAPSLPNSIILFFDTLVGKLLFLFLIGYVASRNIQVALMVAVAYLVTLHVLNQRSTEQFNNYRENFICAPGDENCEGYESTDPDAGAAPAAGTGAGTDADDDEVPEHEHDDEGNVEGDEVDDHVHVEDEESDKDIPYRFGYDIYYLDELKSNVNYFSSVFS